VPLYLYLCLRVLASWQAHALHGAYAYMPTTQNAASGTICTEKYMGQIAALTRMRRRHRILCSAHNRFCNGESVSPLTPTIAGLVLYRVVADVFIS